MRAWSEALEAGPFLRLPGQLLQTWCPCSLPTRYGGQGWGATGSAAVASQSPCSAFGEIRPLQEGGGPWAWKGLWGCPCSRGRLGKHRVSPQTLPLSDDWYAPGLAAPGTAQGQAFSFTGEFSLLSLRQRAWNQHPAQTCKEHTYLGEHTVGSEPWACIPRPGCVSFW